MTQSIHPPTTASAHIRLVHVVKNYHTPAGEFCALNDINLSISSGTLVGVIGKSGAGKSTLVNILTGVDHISSGEIWVGNFPLHKKGENDLAQWRGENVGVVYQSFQLLPMLTLVENIMLPMDFTGNYRPITSHERALHLLEEVELTEHANKTPNLLSGGQQQRVAIARALANDPDILVADEPTGNLDSVTAEHIFQMFEGLVARGKTVIIVTHDGTEADRFHHLIRLADGRVITDQTNGQFKAKWIGGMRR